MSTGKVFVPGCHHLYSYSGFALASCSSVCCSTVHVDEWFTGPGCSLVGAHFPSRYKCKSPPTPGLNANEIQIPYDNHYKVSPLVTSYQTTHNSVKYEVRWKCKITLPNMKY